MNKCEIELIVDLLRFHDLHYLLVDLIAVVDLGSPQSAFTATICDPTICDQRPWERHHHYDMKYFLRPRRQREKAFEYFEKHNLLEKKED